MSAVEVEPLTVIGTMIRACPKADTENGGRGTCSPCSDEHQPWLRRRWHACPVRPPHAGETPDTPGISLAPSRLALLTMEVRRRGMTKCLHGHLHDWRHLEQHARYENVDTDDEHVVTVDVWYCTRCRKIEQDERERIKTSDD